MNMCGRERLLSGPTQQRCSRGDTPHCSQAGQHGCPGCEVSVEGKASESIGRSPLGKKTTGMSHLGRVEEDWGTQANGRLGKALGP